MRKFAALVFFFTLMGVALSRAENSAATLTVVVNKVNHGVGQSAISSPAVVGTQLKDGEYVKTGAASRAELLLANKTVTRVGSNTIFNYTASTSTMNLEAGTLFFSKPKDGQELTIKTGAVAAAITGTTGFVSQVGKTFVFGLVEGSSDLTINGQVNHITAGQIFFFTPPGSMQTSSFDVPRFLKTSPLVTSFHDDLPNDKFIATEVNNYNQSSNRGFLKPVVQTQGPTPTITFYSYSSGSLPKGTTQTSDVASNSLHAFVVSQTPPPAPQTAAVVFPPPPK